ncbi:phosphonate C-P lyase system protein PhnG [Roseibium sp. HPY-6]|uniref:phosphonate C-P lyase system protein PhnG n=1 Tax=Roseibium sp. HPY-6 TaxID=3229852 RepID=UPI00339003CE
MTETSTPEGTSNPTAGAQLERRKIMATLAAAAPDAVAEKFHTLEAADYELVRQPETGLVMVRGRMGGTGNPFNLGEVTVTRCVVRLATGETGSSYSLGRNKEKALHAALIDARWQRDEDRVRIEQNIIAPLAEAHAAAGDTVKEETEATKVNFFTMVRGDN